MAQKEHPLRTFRNLYGLSQWDIARIMETDNTFISAVERGRQIGFSGEKWVALWRVIGKHAEAHGFTLLQMMSANIPKRVGRPPGPPRSKFERPAPAFQATEAPEAAENRL